MTKKLVSSTCFKFVITTLLVLFVMILLPTKISATVPGGMKSDGVYALRNKATGKYLDIQYDSPDEEMYIQQYAYGSVPASESDRSGLFKFTHNGNNYYFIRTMRNNANSFYRKNDLEVRTKHIDPYDSNNSVSACWCLENAGSGYVYIRAYGENKYLCAPTSSVNSGKYCTTESQSSAGDRAKWEMIPYTGATISGVTFQSYETSVFMESNVQYSAFMWTTDITNNGPIVWSVENSNNSALPCSATISGNGVLHTNAVYETVDVCANPGWGTIYYVVVQVMPPLESGIYTIMSDYSNMYMDIRADSGDVGANMQQYDYGEEPHEERQRAGLYKVYWTGTGNEYVIRTMTNNNNGFAPKSTDYESEIITQKITSSSPCKWYITRDEYGKFVIKPSPTSLYAIGVQDTTSSGSSGGKLSCLKLISKYISKAKWIFSVPSDLEPFSAVAAYYPESHIIPMGETYNIQYDLVTWDYFYSTELAKNSPGTISSFVIENPSGGFTYLAYRDGTQIVTRPDKAGVISIRIIFNNGTMTVSESINFYIEPTEGEYFFIQNVQSDVGFVQSDGITASKAQFTYDDVQIWQRISAGDGYYYIRNQDGKYLTAPEASTLEEPIGLSSSLLGSSSINRQKWRFETAPSGTGATRIRLANNPNLFLNINYSSNMLVQSTYMNNLSYYDEFNVIMIGEEVVYHRTHEGWPPIDPSITIKNLAKYYDSFTLLHPRIQFGEYSPSNVDVALGYLQNCKVMIFSGHAAPTVITIHEPPQEYLSSEDIYDPYDPSISLSNVDIVIFAGCSSGGNICCTDEESSDFCCPNFDSDGNIHNCIKEGCPCCAGQYNLPKAAEMAGAKVAIGWQVTQWDNYPIEWIDKFFDYMTSVNSKTGRMYTAQQALDATNHDLTVGDVDKAVLFGTDPDFRLD